MHLAIFSTFFAVAFAAPHTTVRTVDVAKAQGNSTLCPFTITVDHDPDRIPSRIKMISCASHHHVSGAEEGARHGGCEALHLRGHRMHCVELRDAVRVHYRGGGGGGGGPVKLDVAVGCTCMVKKPGLPVAVPADPH